MITLKDTLRAIRGDLPLNNSALKAFLRDYLFSASFRVLLNFRIGKYFSSKRFYFFKLFAYRYKYRMIRRRGCDFSHNCVIGSGLRLPHPLGVVIGDGVVINNNVMIFQQVTIGSHGKKSKEKSYPIIEDDVKIYTGAKIIGGVTIGKGAVVAANSVVNKDVAPGQIVGGIPAKVLTISSSVS